LASPIPRAIALQSWIETWADAAAGKAAAKIKKDLETRLPTLSFPLVETLARI